MKAILSIPPLQPGLTLEQRRQRRAHYYQDVLNAQARINAVWVLGQWEESERLRKLGDEEAADRAVPKCCAKCNGTRYVPKLNESDTIELLSSPELFAAGKGECGSIAACHTGHKIAEAFVGSLPKPSGGTIPAVSWDEACRLYIVKMAPGPDPKKPMLMHAICNDNGKVLDPTIGMPR